MLSSFPIVHLSMIYDPERRMFRNEFLKIEKIGAQEYVKIVDPEETNIIEIKDGISQIQTIQGETRQLKKVSCRRVIVRDLYTGEKKWIKMYRKFTVQPS